MAPLPVLDGHNDALLSLHAIDRGGGRSFFERSERGHLDLPRARAGGFAGGMFACFVPGADEDDESDAPVPFERAHRVTTELAAQLDALEAERPDALRKVRSARDVEACLTDGRIAAVLHFEGAETIDAELRELEPFHERGLRSLGLTWSRPNAFAHGVPFRMGSPDTGPGLTVAGRRLVGACNTLGVIVDVSHLNERGFWDVAAVSRAPLVASHSNAHAIAPCTRNLTDPQLDAIGASGGIVGINFHVGFLRSDGAEELDTPLEWIARHAAHVAERIGVDHVGLGSDFDGATMPAALGDAAGLPRVIDALRDAGWGDDDLAKIAHGNWLRVMRATWGA